MLFRKTSLSERVMGEVIRTLAYSKTHLHCKTDSDLENLQQSYSSSLWRRICKFVGVPVLADRYRFQEDALNSELMARGAVSRYEAGKPACGITGF